MEKRRKKGLTLLELMVTVVVLLIAILALWRVYLVSADLTIQAEEMSIATDDLKDIFEYIKSLPFSDITNSSLGGFPNGSTVNATIVGGFRLNNEAITITYPSGSTANPLNITANVTWTSRNGRARWQVFRTIRTSY